MCGISANKMEALSIKRDEKHAAKAEIERNMKGDENERLRRQKESQNLAAQMREISQELVDAVLQLEISNANDIFQYIDAHALLLYRHPLGAQFVMYFSIRGTFSQQTSLAEQMTTEVVQIAKDRWGTEVVQQIVMDSQFPLAEKRMILKKFSASLQKVGMQSISLFEDPSANFLIHASLKAVEHGRLPFKVVRPMIEGLIVNLDALLWRQKTNFAMTYKVVMWVLESCSSTAAGRETGAATLDWATNRLAQLINHKYGNILLQHVVAFGNSAHRQKIAEAGLNSFRQWLGKTRSAANRSRWFASNVLRACTTHMVGEQLAKLTADLLEILSWSSGPGDTWCLHRDYFRRLCEDKCNKFLARCIYELANEHQRNLMKGCHQDIDAFSFYHKVNNGFTSSLWFCPFSTLGATGEEETTIFSSATRLFDECLWLATYGLPIPSGKVGETLAQLDLGRKYGMFPFALETNDDGVCIRVGPNSQLPDGGKLWVCFEARSCSAKMESLMREFDASQAFFRWLKLTAFEIKDIPDWDGAHAGPLGLDLRGNHGIHFLGVCDSIESVVEFHADDFMLQGEKCLVILQMDDLKMQELIAGDDDDEADGTEHDEEIAAEHTDVWSTLGATEEEKTSNFSIATCFWGACFWLATYGLPIPSGSVGQTLTQLDLGRKYGMFPFALETDEDVWINVDPNTQLPEGGKLWICFEAEACHERMQSLMINLGASQALCRWMKLAAFNIKDMRHWVSDYPGAMGLDLRRQLGIYLLGVWDSGESVFDFRSDGVLLELDKSLVILQMDELKIVELIAVEDDEGDEEIHHNLDAEAFEEDTLVFGDDGVISL